MSTLVIDQIETEIANLKRVTRGSYLFFGEDMDCGTDFDAFMSTTRDPKKVLIQAVVRRLTTSRGSAPDALAHGIDARDWVSLETTEADLRTRAGQIRQELIKDQRVKGASVDMRANADFTSLQITIRIEPADPSVQPFPLVFDLTSSALVLESGA
jgi:hypothetical protein